MAVVVGVARVRWPGAADAPPARRRQPPAPQRPPSFTRPLAAGALLLLCGITASGWTLWQQDRVTEQEATARTTTAVVREHLDDGAIIGLELPDGTSWHTEVLDANDYPIGSRTEVLVDNAGLRQLRSEPYDITMLLLPAVTAAGLAVAHLVRIAARRRDLRRLLTGPQPVRPARAALRGEDLIVLVPGPAGTAEQFVMPISGDPQDEAPAETSGGAQVRTEPALLYGAVRPGQWCAVQIGDRLHVPCQPVSRVETVRYDGNRGLPADIDDDGEPSVARADLLPQDRDPTEPREYRLTSPQAWGRVVVAGAAGAAGLAVLAEGFSPSLVAAAAVIGAMAGTEWGWRLYLRPRLRWSLGGVSAVTPWRRHRTSWTPDSGLDLDETGHVQVTDGHAEFTMPVRGGASHNERQLVAALRHARRLALRNPEPRDPPPLMMPARPGRLHLIWAGLSIAVITLSLTI
ncbi:hypothetical protein [Actinoplanes sp. NPDC049802]|uniref:hypothetical protein n=1 Tax=Actinoplanes sp. NPDC049802 TaxID=3154742 RepID=UPI0033BFD35D